MTQNDQKQLGRTLWNIVEANPPFSLRWDPSEVTGKDIRFKNHGVATKSAADFAFLLHGFHFLKEDGVMAIILPHGVLFRAFPFCPTEWTRIHHKTLPKAVRFPVPPRNSRLSC